MYSILILAPQDDVEELDLPEALDPQLCSRLSGKRDLPLPLQQPLLFLIGPLSLQRDYLRIKNAVGDLCSERFIEVLANLSVPFTAYPANLLERGTDHPVSDRYFFWLPKRIRSEEVVDWERSEVRTDAETGFRRMAKLVLKAEAEATAPLLFETAGGCLVHDTLRTRMEAAGIRGILFAPLDTASNPYAGVKMVETKRYLQAHPDDWQQQVELSRVLKAFHRYNEALEALDHALTLKPDDADTWYKRGQILYRLGRLQEALKALKQAIVLDHESWAWKEYSSVLRDLGCYEEALASAQQLVQVKDKAYLAWYELALAHKALGHDEEALQALERALRAGGNALPTIPKAKGIGSISSDGMRKREQLTSSACAVARE